MSQSVPLVSVVIPVYNGEEVLERAIKSVLSQTYPNIELIVVDDGSTDGTGEVAKRFPEVNYLRHTKNINASSARNTGIKAASGDFIALLDSDDEWLPRKVMLQVQMLEGLDEEWQAVYAGHDIYAGGKIESITEYPQGDLTYGILNLNYKMDAGSTVLYR